MSDCDVMPAFYSYSERVARKQHRCCECHAPILVGEKHFFATGKWDGELSSHRQHLLCMEACVFIRDNLNDWECLAFGELFDWWWDCGRRERADYRLKVDKWKTIRGMIAKIKRRKRSSKT